jgi:hypothetical protein
MENIWIALHRPQKIEMLKGFSLENFQPNEENIDNSEIAKV